MKPAVTKGPPKPLPLTHEDLEALKRTFKRKRFEKIKPLTEREMEKIRTRNR